MSVPSAAELKSAVTLNWPAILLGIVVVLLWEGFTRGLDPSKNLFPPPSLVLWSLYVRADLLLDHAWLTFSQTVLGFVISVVVGIALGWTICKSRLLFEAIYPVIVVLQVVPKEALAPLLVLWFGAGTLSRTILAFLIAFFPMVINTILGVRGLHPRMRDYASSLSCGPWQFFSKVELPSALPCDLCRHEDIRHAFGYRGRGCRDDRRAQWARLSPVVRIEPARHGIFTRHPARSRHVGRCDVRRRCVAGTAADLLAAMKRYAAGSIRVR